MTDPHRPSFRLDFSGSRTAGTGVFGRAVGTIVGVGAFVVAFLVGSALFLVVLGLALAFAAVIGVRWWWWQRKLAAVMRDQGGMNRPSEGGDADGDVIEGEYREVDR
ncbi:MAG: hypothetical protein AAF004_09585 [Pseudomonadota bacterium]